MLVLTENGVVRSVPKKLSDTEKAEILERSRQKIESLKQTRSGYPVFLCRNCCQRETAAGEIFCAVCISKEIQDRLGFSNDEPNRPHPAIVAIIVGIAFLVAFAMYYLAFQPESHNKNQFSNSQPARSALLFYENNNLKKA